MNSNHLTFSIPSGGEIDSPPLKIRLHQATDDDDNQGENETNTGFVMWPAAVLLSHHLTKNPSIVIGDDSGPGGDVMELGAGCGLVGLTAATMLENDDSGNDDKVIFTDYNPAVLDNLKRNITLNKFSTPHKVLGLDWFDQMPSDDNDGEAEDTWVDMNGTSHGRARLILGADLLVCSNDAELVAATINCALKEGGQAVILGASADARFGVANFPEECRSLGLNVTVDENILEAREDSTVEGDDTQQELMDDLELSGHNQRASTIGHDFTMFTIDKPITSY